MTAQYYLWYMALWPLAAMNNEMSVWKHAVWIVTWIYGQAFWGYFANGFENEGKDTIPQIQYANYQWFIINTVIMLLWAKN